MATQEYGLSHSRLLDLLEPPPPPKVEDDEDEEPEEEEEEEGAPKGPPPAPQLVAQREVREQRITLEARQAELEKELSEAIKRDDERAAAAQAAEERAARKAERAAARAAAIEAGEEPEEEDEEEEEEDEVGQDNDSADDEDDDDAEAPPPERTQDEIRADIDATYDAWRSALLAESDASIVCVGLQAANRPRPGPVRCTFDAAYVEDKDQVWATARLDVDPAAVETESARCTDLLIVLDTTPSMEQHLHLLKRSLYDLLRSMESTDRLCIVGVSYKAQLLLDWTSTDGEGKAECRAAIRDITTRGGSKICPSGMEPILDHVVRALGKARPKAVPTGMWLCASPFGAPDERYDLRRSFSGSLRAAVAANFSATMSTIGVGSRSDSAMLSRIAEAGRGTFLYVPDCVMLSEHLGRALASSRTTAASNVHAIVEGASPVSLVEVEQGYGLSNFNAKAAGRKSSFFRSGKVTTVDLGPIRALQSRIVHFKVKLPNAAVAGKMSKQTPLARVVFVYATGEANAPNVHSASLRVADVPRLCVRKPSAGGTRIRFCFSNPNEEFNARPFQEALAQRLDVKNAMVPVDKVTHHREFHTGQSIVDMRIAKLSAQATSDVLTRVQQLYDAGELHAIANGEPKETEETKDQGPEQAEEKEEEKKDGHPEEDEIEALPAQPALEQFLRPGYDTMQRAVQCATAQLLRARASVRFGLEGGDSPEGVKTLQDSEKALAQIVDMAELAAADPAGRIRATAQVELAVPSDRSQAMLALSSSHRVQHAAALPSCPGVDVYATPAARKMGDSFAVSQCDREEMPLQMKTPTVDVVSVSSLRVSWEQPEVYSGPPVKSYALTIVKAATGKTKILSFAAPRSSCCIDGLEPDFYFVSMTASNGKRSSPSSSTAVCAVPAEPSSELLAAPVAVSVEVDGARWRWHPSLGAWDRVPSTDDNGVWPARVTKAQRLRDSVPDSPTWRVAPSSSSSIDVEWDAPDGNGAIIEAYVLMLVSAAGEQSTFRFSGKVREARISDRAPGSYSACLVACTADRTGAISDPVDVQISEEEDEEPAQAVAYYEFTIGGTTHTRAM